MQQPDRPKPVLPLLDPGYVPTDTPEGTRDYLAKQRGPGRPSQGGPTTSRSVRSGQVWDDLERYYTARGEKMSTIVNRLLDAEAARLRAAGEL